MPHGRGSALSPSHRGPVDGTDAATDTMDCPLDFAASGSRRRSRSAAKAAYPARRSDVRPRFDADDQVEALDQGGGIGKVPQFGSKVVQFHSRRRVTASSAGGPFWRIQTKSHRSRREAPIYQEEASVDHWLDSALGLLGDLPPAQHSPTRRPLIPASRHANQPRPRICAQVRCASRNSIECRSERVG